MCSSAKPSCNYCGVINRIGTGEAPDTVGVEAVAVLLQPAVKHGHIRIAA